MLDVVAVLGLEGQGSARPPVADQYSRPASRFSRCSQAKDLCRGTQAEPTTPTEVSSSLGLEGIGSMTGSVEVSNRGARSVVAELEGEMRVSECTPMSHDLQDARNNGMESLEMKIRADSELEPT